MLLPVVPVAPTTATRGFWLAIVASCLLESLKVRTPFLYPSRCGERCSKVPAIAVFTFSPLDMSTRIPNHRG